MLFFIFTVVRAFSLSRPELILIPWGFPKSNIAWQRRVKAKGSNDSSGSSPIPESTRWKFLSTIADYLVLLLLFFDFILCLGQILDVRWINTGLVVGGSYCMAQGTADAQDPAISSLTSFICRDPPTSGGCGCSSLLSLNRFSHFRGPFLPRDVEMAQEPLVPRRSIHPHRHLHHNDNFNPRVDPPEFLGRLRQLGIVLSLSLI